MYKYVNQKDPKNEYVFGQHPVMGDMTISKCGCGLCSASMVVENLTGKSFPLPEVIEMAKEWNYAHSGKTICEMKVLAPVIAETFGLRLQMSNSADELVEWLENGGMAIVHLAGYRKEDGHVGLMSQGGHYVCAVKTEGRRLTILDPSQAPGKYDIEGRREYITYNGNEVHCDADLIADDCKTKLPYFYMFALKG